jgi:glucokinase
MRTAVGIDIGGTHIRAARLSSEGRILAHQAVATLRDASVVVDAIAELIAALRADDIFAVGIGIPGRVDSRSGRILSGGYVDLSRIDLARQLQERTGLRVHCDNDANMALLAEARLGAAKGKQQAIMLTIGTGIGGAILDGGHLFHGGGVAGQLGHITVSLDGEICNCGRRGCLETESSGTALQRHLAREGFSSADVHQVMQDNSDAARRVIDNWARPLRLGIDSLVAAFSPETVVLGGGLGRAACAALSSIPAASAWFQYDVVPAQLGDEAGVIGAGLAALEQTQ